LPGTATAVALVTSRNQLAGLVATDGARPLALGLLSAGEARDLLTRRLGRDQVAAQPRAVGQIVTACAGLPLAVNIVAARAQLGAVTLTTLAGELGRAGARLAALDVGDPASDVRAVFSWSYTALTPPAGRLFRLLGLHPGPDIAAPAAASLGGHPLPQARPLLAELVQASQLTQPVPGRYVLHDLLGDYAAGLTRDRDAGEVRRAAVARLLDHYAHTGRAADRILHPVRDSMALPLGPAAPGTSLDRPEDASAAMAWQAAEYAVLLALVRTAADTGFDAHAWQLTWAVHTYLARRARWQDMAGVWQTALRSADRLPDPAARTVAQTSALRLLAFAHTMLGRYAPARAHLEAALHLGVEAGDRVSQAYTHGVLGQTLSTQGDVERAVVHDRQALALFEAAGHRRGQARAMNEVGCDLVELGEYAEAVTVCEQAVALNREVGDQEGEANAWDSLGYAHHHQGRHAEAADCYRQALALYRKLDNLAFEAGTLVRLGDTQQAAGHSPTRSWAEALRIFTELGRPNADEVRAKLAGVA
jgi:tetratricopeptide (TPR) repeat protein